MSRTIEKVTILGANGAMGSGSGEIFAARGIPTWFLAREKAKAEGGVERAQGMAKAEKIADYITAGSYDDDFDRAVADSDLVFECVAERLDLKQQIFERVDAVRKPGSIVATVSSGLSIADMAAGRSDDFRKHFLGIHLFNPPNVIVGCEVIPQADTDPELLAFVIEYLETELGRKVVQTADLPAFAGNRVGFKVLNEVAQLAEEHGVAYMDMLIGPHTGRAMPPLATVDLVGWDVHRAIVDNLYENTDDEAHATFELPAYMAKLIEAGHLGNKTPDKGGFVKTVRNGKDKKSYVLDPASGDYRPAEPVEVPEFASRMKALHRNGRYHEAGRVFLEAGGRDADLMRKVILGYVSYGLNRVGTVVESAAGVDRIMGFGFNWAPPGVLVDLLGAADVVAALEKADLPVPEVVAEAASSGQAIFQEPFVDRGRFFVG